MKKKIRYINIPSTYNALVAFHPPRILHDEGDFAKTIAVVEALAGHRLTKDQDDYLELLSRIIENYEDETIPEPDDLAKTAEKLATATKKSEIRRLHRQFFIAWYGRDHCNKPDVKGLSLTAAKGCARWISPIYRGGKDENAWTARYHRLPDRRQIFAPCHPGLCGRRDEIDGAWHANN